MYYKEKWIGHELHYTLSPNGNWIPFTIDMYAQKVRELQQQVKSVDLADVVGLLPFSEPEELASWMHNTYEDVAVSEGWDTQDNCKVDFSKLPNENKQTMIEVARRILELRK